MSQEADAVPFHRPSMTEAEVEAAVEVLRSGWLTTGRRAQALEAAFAARIERRHALALNSATAGLHLALEAFGVGAGDEVIIPTYTFTACGEVCVYLRARPRLVDVGEDDYLLSAGAVADAIGPATRAIVPVHFGGLAVDPGPLRQAAEGRPVRIVEDAAHALPSSVAGRQVGQLGDAAVFSFYATKTMTTGGEGGMLVTDDDTVAERVASMRLHGISADAWNRYGAGGRWFYEVLDAGYKYNLTDLAAAIGLVQLRRVNEMAARRTAIARRYDEILAESPLVELPPRRDGDVHAWHLYVVRLNLELLSADRASVIDALAARGIGASVHFIPLHLHPYYQRAFGYRPGDFPVAERLYERSISLPIWPDMEARHVELVTGALLEVLDAARRPAVV